MKLPKTIAVDFDGVIHSYESGWTGPEPIDAPVIGALAGVAALKALGYRVVVFSCRALTAEGRAATERWLRQWGIDVDEVTGIKPHAALYVDDRAHRFDGDWETVVRLCLGGTPKPWNADRQPPPWQANDAVGHRCGTCGAEVYEVTPEGRYAACGHAIPGGEAVS